MKHRVPNPLTALRNLLNSAFLPPAARIEEMAVKRGLTISPASHRKKLDKTKFPKVALGERGAAALARIESLLETMSVPFFRGGAGDAWTPCINITDVDLPIVISMIENWLASDPSIFISTPDGNVHTVDAFRARKKGDAYNFLKILCVESLPADGIESNIKPSSEILINVWAKTAHYDKENVYESGIPTPFARRVREHTIRFLQEGCKDLGQISPPNSSRVNFPIDVVYTWVNDQDHEWLELKSSYADAAGKGRANHAERFRNRDELKYSFRSIEMFAPFVRNIYLVTNGQIPEWLNLDNPRVRVVTHAEIYRNPDHLPTFNSSGIETQLHHVPGLAEHFLYFNDDFFLGSYCTPEDFFHPNGALKYFPTDQRVCEADVNETTEEYLLADVNGLGLIRGIHGSSNVEIMSHVPYPSSKSLLERMENHFATSFEKCASSRFRSPNDIRPIAFMQYHFGYQEHLTVPDQITHRYLALWKPTIDKQFDGVAKNRAFKTICINDVGVDPAKVEQTDKLVHDFLNAYFPFKSSFEK